MRLGTKISSIRRGPEGVQISCVGAPTEFEAFDKVVMAISPDLALPLLEKPSEAEAKLFAGGKSLNALEYFSTVASASGLPKWGYYVFKQFVEDSSTAGHCQGFLSLYEDSDVYIFFSMGLPGI